MQQTMRKPARRRFNLRLTLFAVVMALLVGFPIYVMVESAWSGGVRQVGDYKKVDLKALGNFPFPNDGRLSDIPAKWRELNGQKVLFDGEIFVPSQVGGQLKEFELVYNIQKCCFGGPPKVQERVYATVPPKLKLPNLTGYAAKVYGILSVSVKTDSDGVVTSVYQLQVEKIDPIGPV